MHALSALVENMKALMGCEYWCEALSPDSPRPRLVSLALAARARGGMNLELPCPTSVFYVRIVRILVDRELSMN